MAHATRVAGTPDEAVRSPQRSGVRGPTVSHECRLVPSGILYTHNLPYMWTQIKELDSSPLQSTEYHESTNRASVSERVGLRHNSVMADAVVALARRNERTVAGSVGTRRQALSPVHVRKKHESTNRASVSERVGLRHDSVIADAAVI